LARAIGKRAKEDERAEAEAALAIAAARHRQQLEISESLVRNLAERVDEKPSGD
jgi:hypothetical protein